MKKKSKLFKINILLVVMAFLSIGLVQVFAGPNNTTAKTKISTVNWNMMSRSNSDPKTGVRTKTNLYWFKFAFLDKSMSSGTLQEICSNDFEQLKKDMQMQGYFYPFFSDNSCPKGEKYGIGIIFRGHQIGVKYKVFENQNQPWMKFGNYARGAICVKHAYLGKVITSCVSHLTFDVSSSKHYIYNNDIGRRQLTEYSEFAKDFAYWTGGKPWAGSSVTFLNGDFNQYPDSVKGQTKGWQDLVKKNTHNALDSKGPQTQLDYILVSEWIWTGRESHTSCNLGSDHCLTSASVTV